MEKPPHAATTIANGIRTREKAVTIDLCFPRWRIVSRNSSLNDDFVVPPATATEFRFVALCQLCRVWHVSMKCWSTRNGGKKITQKSVHYKAIESWQRLRWETARKTVMGARLCLPRVRQAKKYHRNISRRNTMSSFTSQKSSRDCEWEMQRREMMIFNLWRIRTFIVHVYVCDIVAHTHPHFTFVRRHRRHRGYWESWLHKCQRLGASAGNLPATDIIQWWADVHMTTLGMYARAKKWIFEECETHSPGNVYKIIEAKNIDWFGVFFLLPFSLFLSPFFLCDNNPNRSYNPFSYTNLGCAYCLWYFSFLYLNRCTLQPPVRFSSFSSTAPHQEWRQQ